MGYAPLKPQSKLGHQHKQKMYSSVKQSLNQWGGLKDGSVTPMLFKRLLFL